MQWLTMAGLTAQQAASFTVQAQQAELEACALLKEEEQAYGRAYNCSCCPLLWQVGQTLCCPALETADACIIQIEQMLCVISNFQESRKLWSRESNAILLVCLEEIVHMRRLMPMAHAMHPCPHRPCFRHMQQDLICASHYKLLLLQQMVGHLSIRAALGFVDSLLQRLCNCVSFKTTVLVVSFLTCSLCARALCGLCCSAFLHVLNCELVTAPLC